jgi:uncharacterized protein YjbJ (UPF0337 family)
MNWDQVEGQWKEIKGRLREKWAKLTDDDLELIAGKKDRLLGTIQSRYGKQKKDAEKELDSFFSSIVKQTEKQRKL